MQTCEHCQTPFETSEADYCNSCWKPRKVASSSSFASNAVNVVGETADTVSNFFIYDAIGDALSAVGTGIGAVAEGVCDAGGAVLECVGDVIGAALD